MALLHRSNLLLGEGSSRFVDPRAETAVIEPKIASQGDIKPPLGLSGTGRRGTSGEFLWTKSGSALKRGRKTGQTIDISGLFTSGSSGSKIFPAPKKYAGPEAETNIIRRPSSRSGSGEIIDPETVRLYKHVTIGSTSDALKALEQVQL